MLHLQRNVSYEWRRKKKVATGKKNKEENLKRAHGVEGDILKKIPDDSLMVFTG